MYRQGGLIGLRVGLLGGLNLEIISQSFLAKSLY